MPNEPGRRRGLFGANVVSEFHDIAAKERAARPKRGNPERVAQISVKTWLHLVFPGCIVAASVNEAPSNSVNPFERARFYGARKRAGVVSGFPDLTVLLDGGRVFFIEMKSATGRLSENQRLVHQKLRSLGHVVIVARDIETASAALRAEGLIR